MEYEQKYNELVEKLQTAKEKSGGYTFASVIDTILPELCESEDERIRKELIERFKWELKGAEEQDAAGCSRQKDIAMFKRGIAWLEKQGEQNPIKQDTEIRDLWEYIKEWKDKFGRLPKDDDELAACIDYVMKRQKKCEWSEEDTDRLNSIIGTIGYCKSEWPTDKMSQDIFNSDIDWLKSLKPRWKPTGEQMYILNWVANTLLSNDGIVERETAKILNELYNDLKLL